MYCNKVSTYYKEYYSILAEHSKLIVHLLFLLIFLQEKIFLVSEVNKTCEEKIHWESVNTLTKNKSFSTTGYQEYGYNKHKQGSGELCSL